MQRLLDSVPGAADGVGQDVIANLLYLAGSICFAVGTLVKMRYG